MRKLLITGIALASFAASLFLATPAFTVKPGEEVNPNGFPSGEHFNLTLNAKKSDYQCTALEYDEFDNPVYGKVIFIPQDTGSYPERRVGILMESGKNGPRNATNCTTLEVTDKCAGFDGGPAVMRLPKNENGYRVYLRAKGTPTDEEMLLFGNLYSVQDENGISLIYLGELTDSALKEEHPITRPKGKIKAYDISYLFKSFGAVCYEGALPDGSTNPGDYTAQCCTFADNDSDGVYEEFTCVDPVDSTCGIGESLLYCTDPSFSDWIFNIEAYVGYLWEVDNYGVRSVQVRFYPN
jgi:hypothetical protein